MKYNLHTHTIFSDGHAHPEEYIREAILRNMQALGFTEHSPLPFENTFSFREEQNEGYLSLMQSLREKYSGQLQVFVGMEMDYIPGMSDDFTSVRERYQLDYLIGSVHLVKPDVYNELWFTDGPHSDTYDAGLREFFGSDIRKAVTTYYHQVNEMISTQQFEVIGHFDKIKMHNKGRFFRESEDWYQDLIRETIRLIKEKGLIVEINTRGIYKKRSDTTFPGESYFSLLKELDIPVMVNSDAHLPEEIDKEFSSAFSQLKLAGYRETAYFNGSSWLAVPIL